MKAAAAGNIKKNIEEGFSLLLKLISETTDVTSESIHLVVKHALQHVKDEAYPLPDHKIHWVDLVAWCSLGVEGKYCK